MKIFLISCVQQQLQRKAPAFQLYNSAWFKLAYEYAQSQKPDKIFILSSKHGLLLPETILDPYDLNLRNQLLGYKKNWAENLLKQLEAQADLKTDKFVVLAGLHYRRYITPHLAHVEIPLEHLRIGQQMHWLRCQLPDGD